MGEETMSQGDFNYEYKFENSFNEQDMDKMKEKKISFNELGRFKIDPEIIFVVTTNERSTFIDCETLNLHSCGPNLEEAKKELISDIEFVWDCYVNGDKNEMTKDAIDFAERFSQHVSRI